MKKKNIKISIVVPVYNVEQFLDECLNSVVNQTYENIEIIIVDDGSTDDCPTKCDKWAKKDNRIIVIHKRNAGLGMARNTGIEHASGDYIYFVDSDDKIDLNTVKTCVDVLTKADYDIIHFGYRRIDLHGNELSYSIPTPEKKNHNGTYEINKVLPFLITDIPSKTKYNVNLSSCMCMIKMSLIRKCNWKFVSERIIISEDLYSILKLYKNVSSIYILPKVLYSYRTNPKSLTQIYRLDRYDKIKHLFDSLKKMYIDFDIQERLSYLYVSYSIACLKSISCSSINHKEKKKNIRYIINDIRLKNEINKNLENDTLKRRILYFFILKNRINAIILLSKLQNHKI